MSKKATVLIAAAAVLILFGVVRAQERAYALDTPALTATEVDGEIVLSWTEVEGATRYDLQVWDCVNEWRPISENVLRTTEAVHTDPADEITYLYTVQALNDRGEESDWAAISKNGDEYDFVRETVNPIPSPDFDVVTQDDHIRLQYSNVEKAVGYQARVWYEGAGDDWLWLPEENLDLDSRTFSYFEVEPGVDYFFVMRSYSENRCGYSDWSAYQRHTFAGSGNPDGGTTGGATGPANTPTPTATPTRQPLPGQISWNASSSTHNSIILSWQAPDPPAAQYRLVLTGSDEVLYEGPATQFTHTGLAANTAYRYAVRGRHGSAGQDWGPWSYQTVWTAADPAELSAYVPGAPVTLEARNDPALGIRLRWRHNARTQPGDCACPVTGHQILRRLAGAGQQFQVIATTGSDANYQDSSASPGVQYSYQVRARNRHGLSDPSGSASATHLPATATPTPTGVTGPANTPTPTATPTRQPLPGQISWNASSSTHNSIILSWQAPDPPAAQYRLVLTGSDEVLYEGPATQFTHTGLAANTAYRYAVRGRHGSAGQDWGPWSYQTVWTAADPAELSAYVPGAPVTLEARNDPALGIRLRWRHNARTQPGDCACPVTGHQILRRLAGAGQQFQVIATTGSDANYQDSSASPGVQYSYQVRARNRHGLSDPSGSASATHLPATAP